LILLIRIREIYRNHIGELRSRSTRSQQLANKFKLLVEKNFIEKRSVSDYAQMMGITSKHLSEVVSKSFGRTPLQIIHDMLFLEARVQLLSTDKSISEISYYLKFDDQPHFNHFIKKRTGLSPQAYRLKK
jgi:AraC family transcriptional regulator, transcriptional activator of pobA